MKQDMKLDNTKKVLKMFATAVIKSAQSNLIKSKVKKSALIKNMEYEIVHRKRGRVIELLEFTFGDSEDYWMYVDEGVRGKGGYKGKGGRGRARGQGSPFKFKKNNIKKGVIDKWIRKKKIRLRNYQKSMQKRLAGTFLAKTANNIKNAAFTIGRAIALRGLTRTQFFTKAYDKNYKVYVNKITQAYAADVAKDVADKMKKHKD